MREKFQLFNVPINQLDDFEDIEQWKFVFFGTHRSFESTNFTKAEFPDYPVVQQNLYIFKPSQLEYLRQLSMLIGSYAKNELLASLQFSAPEMGEEDESFKLPFIKADGKYITADNTTRADIYLFKIKIEKLLRIARVSRYEGIPFILENDENHAQYQRLLIDKKLKDIAEGFVNNNSRKSFPNTITIVLSDDCSEVDTDEGAKLEIPKVFC